MSKKLHGYVCDNEECRKFIDYIEYEDDEMSCNGSGWTIEDDFIVCSTYCGNIIRFNIDIKELIYGED